MNKNEILYKFENENMFDWVALGEFYAWKYVINNFKSISFKVCINLKYFFFKFEAGPTSIILSTFMILNYLSTTTSHILMWEESHYVG